MKKTKKWLLAPPMITLLIFLSGCVDVDKTGTPTGKGWMYNYLVAPVGSVITYFVDHFNWSYGVAIIFITLIVRVIILPLGLSQSKKSLTQSEKMIVLKPQIDEAQKKLKEAATQEEQLKAQKEMQAVYKENGLSMTGGIGCLPLLIQMPIFTALLYAVKFTPGINESTFLGVNLGESNLIFVALAGLSYLLQSYIGTIGIPEEQKKTMRSMMIMSPLMIVFISFRSPAGVVLYWIVGGVFSCVQTLITNFYHKPKIKAAIAEELKNNPPKQVVTPSVKKVKAAEPIKNKPVRNNHASANERGRNAGQQQKRNK